MRPSQWRSLGYLLTFQTLDLPEHINPQQCVVLHHRKLKTCFCTLIHNGHWQSHDDLTEHPWFALHNVLGFTQSQLYQRLQQIAAVCYCARSETCDFCAGLRQPLEL
jgi:hypothetical protein